MLASTYQNAMSRHAMRKCENGYGYLSTRQLNSKRGPMGISNLSTSHPRVCMKIPAAGCFQALKPLEKAAVSILVILVIGGRLGFAH